MVVERLQIGGFGTNCYVAANQDTKEAYVVDPGDDGKAVADYLKKHGYDLKGILLTHGHVDHILGVKELKEQMPASVYAHEAEKKLLGDPDLNLTKQFGRTDTLEADHYLKDGDTLDTIGLAMQVIATPGHTAGGCCYYFPEEKVLFSGDTLFCGSIGRTDFPTGNTVTLLTSIKDKLLVLDDHISVYPGHQQDTTIGRERRDNPFING